LHLFVDTPMHLLFLGIAKSVFGRVGVWSNRCGRGPAFRKMACSLLKDLENLKLQWLTFNVKSFDTWGGWVSEKFQSLSRVALWVYGGLMVIDDIPPFVEPVGRSVDQWYKEDYKKWLRVRGKPTGGDKNELRDRVKNYMSLPEEQQPKFLPPECGTATGMMDMLRFMVLMFTTLLQPAVEGEKHAEMVALRIRLFMNATVAFEGPLQKKKRNKNTAVEEGAVEDDGEEDVDLEGEEVATRPEKSALPVWLGRSNYLCLLNLPDTIREFGSLRNYFEGKYMGERFVQEVKDARERCSHQNVTFNLLKKLHQGKAIDLMTGTQTGRIQAYKSSEKINTKKASLKGNVRIYPDRAHATVAYHAKKPISAIENKNGDIAILFYENGSNRGNIKLLGLDRKLDDFSVYQGLRYWKWELSNMVMDFLDWDIKDFVVLLQKQKGEEGEYTMVTKEWSPAMLEHYEYSRVGMETKPKMDENAMDADGWGITSMGRNTYSI
jgi:hypothetical protein